MERSLYFIIFLNLTFWSCKIEEKFNGKVVATINNERIYQTELDSIISDQLYELRRDILELIINNKTLEYEARAQNISVDALIENEVNRLCNTIDDLNKRKRNTALYIDSLKKKYSVNILLNPGFFKSIETKNLYSLDFNGSNNDIEVFIISNFSCPACFQIKDRFLKIIEKFDNKVTFKYVYYDSYIDKSILACYAAGKQGKFNQIYNLINSSNDIILNDSIYYNFAIDLDLDLHLFEKDFNESSSLRKFLNNRDYLMNQGIFHTPFFIVNNMVLEKDNAIDYLENVINEEITNKSY